MVVEPGLDDATFERIAQEAFGRIPAKFREQLTNVSVSVEQEPAPDQKLEKGELLGLFYGINRAAYYADKQLVPASTITIFRGPLERCYQSPQALADAINEVVFHEVGHYFGISDARLDELEADKWAAIKAEEEAFEKSRAQ